jgi:hypothetical protein
LVVAATFGFAVLYGQKVLRKRITHPRTGYVKYQSSRRQVWRIAAGLVAAVAVPIATAFVLRRLEPHSSEVVDMAKISAAFGLGYVFITRMDAAWRWVVPVALIVAPPAVATVPLGRLWLGNLPIVLMGLIFFVSGAITLTLYLRRNPLPGQVAE